MKRELIVLILLSFCFNSCKKETGIIKLGDLEGVVRNEFQQPIEGVKVEIEDAEYTTSFDGKYIFKKLPEKEYTISATKQSYLTNIQIITVVADSNIILDFIMSSGETLNTINQTLIVVFHLATLVLSWVGNILFLFRIEIMKGIHISTKLQFHFLNQNWISLEKLQTFC